jgi:outer membrane lipoprotein
MTNHGRTALAIPLLLALAACTTTPDPLSGTFADISPGDAARNDSRGTTVRWGGTVAAVEPLPDRTCFQIVGRELDDRGRPILDDKSSGRFLACRSGFYDPEVFAEGRSLTLIGTIDGAEARMIGEYEYLHPRLAADVVFLWPEDEADRSPPIRYNFGFHYGRFR